MRKAGAPGALGYNMRLHAPSRTGIRKPPVQRFPRLAPGRRDTVYAHPHPRHLRHLHGRSRRSRARGGPQGHRLRRRRLPADEHAARGARHRADRRLRRRTACARTRPVRDRQRRLARQSADGGDPRSRAALYVGAAVARRARAARQMGARGRRHARQDDDQFDARLDAGRRRAESGLPDRRRAAELRRFGAADRFELLRDRSRRIRHRVLRQALASSSTTGRAPRC